MMKKISLFAALLLLSSPAFADGAKGLDDVRVIGGSGDNAKTAKDDALKTANQYCQKKFGTHASVLDWTTHPMSSKELYMLLVDYTCGDKEKALKSYK